MAKKPTYVKMMTPPFRLSFPNLFEPKLGPDGAGTPKYSIRMLFPKSATGKDAEMLKAIRDQCAKAAVEFWDGKVPEDLKKPLKDGDKSDKESERGHWVMNARTTTKPGVVNARCIELTTKEEIERQLYAGCWARATVLVGANAQYGSKYVHLILNNIQFLKDDEPFTGRQSASDEFQPVEYSPQGADFKDSGDGF